MLQQQQLPDSSDSRKNQAAIILSAAGESHKGLARRKKRGFGVPVAAFLRKEWKECAEKILLQGDLVKRGFFDENGIKSLLQEHCSAKRDHSYLLLSLMMAEESLKKKER